MATKWKSQPKEVLRHWITSLKEPTVFNTVLTEWERYFVESLEHQLSAGGVLSQKQHEKLEDLYASKTK